MSGLRGDANNFIKRLTKYHSKMSRLPTYFKNCRTKSGFNFKSSNLCRDNRDLIEENNSSEGLLEVVKNRYPSVRGFSLRSVKRFCSYLGVAVEGAISKVKLICETHDRNLTSLPL